MIAGALLVDGLLVRDWDLSEAGSWSSVVGAGDGDVGLEGGLASSEGARESTLWTRGVRGQRMERRSGRHLIDRQSIIMRTDLRHTVSNLQ